MAKMLTRCPVCEAALGVSELTCGHCKTRIKGSFEPCRFCRLPSDHLSFVEMFLRCEGNLSRVEKELGISYPTVRNKLTAALIALGFMNGAGESTPEEAESPAEAAAEPSAESSEKRRHVLDSLANGSMSAEEAAEILRTLA